jgi:glycosyltransferase involved in cell wall biosynthesis
LPRRIAPWWHTHFHRHGHPLTNALFLAAERLAGRWTDRLVVINDDDEREARKHRIVSPLRLVRMPGIGLDTSSELNRNKRQADAVEALAIMQTRRAYLVVIGDGALRPEIEAVARQRNVEGRVRLVGHIEDVRTALVATSRREGLNRSIMEALALEVPVIATTARGNQELVGDAGIMAEVGDRAALAAGMDWLVDHPDERRAMGLRGRARMVAEYDLELVIERHLAMYGEMLLERRRQARQEGGRPTRP